MHWSLVYVDRSSFTLLLVRTSSRQDMTLIGLASLWHLTRYSALAIFKAYGDACSHIRHMPHLQSFVVYDLQFDYMVCAGLFTTRAWLPYRSQMKLFSKHPKDVSWWDRLHMRCTFCFMIVSRHNSLCVVPRVGKECARIWPTITPIWMKGSMRELSVMEAHGRLIGVLATSVKEHRVP